MLVWMLKEHKFCWVLTADLFSWYIVVHPTTSAIFVPFQPFKYSAFHLFHSIKKYDRWRLGPKTKSWKTFSSLTSIIHLLCLHHNQPRQDLALPQQIIIQESLKGSLWIHPTPPRLLQAPLFCGLHSTTSIWTPGGKIP